MNTNRKVEWNASTSNKQRRAQRGISAARPLGSTQADTSINTAIVTLRIELLEWMQSAGCTMLHRAACWRHVPLITRGARFPLQTKHTLRVESQKAGSNLQLVTERLSCCSNRWQEADGACRLQWKKQKYDKTLFVTKPQKQRVTKHNSLYQRPNKRTWNAQKKPLLRSTNIQCVVQPRDTKCQITSQSVIPFSFQNIPKLLSFWTIFRHA